MGKKDKTEKKPATEKKARKTRDKMRSRKESPAGHFADKLRAYSKQANAVMAKVEKFPGVAEAVTTEDVIAALEKLASESFVPARGKGGNRGTQFTIGQRVTLTAEAIAMLKPQQPNVDKVAAFVGEGYDGGKSVPVRANGPKLDDPWIGFVSKKWITAFADTVAVAA